MDRPPQFALGDLVRSRVDPSCGYVVTGHVYRRTTIDYLCAGPHGAEEVRGELELEQGERLRDPISAD